ncbi:MAG: hypothetical protein HY688_03695 [Chloroflexi bacterium]|nr:hypothetical protein [Chloroflexota bacterium]
MNRIALLWLGALSMAALVGWIVGGLFPSTLTILRPLREALPWVERAAPPVHIAALSPDREHVVAWEPLPGGRTVSRVRYRILDERGEVLREDSLPPDTHVFPFPRDPAWYPPEASCAGAPLRTRLALRLWYVYEGEKAETSATAERSVVVDYTAPVLDLGRVGFQVDPQGPLPSGSLLGYPLRLHVAACDNLTPPDQVLYRFAVWSDPSYQLVQRSETWKPVSEQAQVVVPAGRYRLEVELRDAVGNTTSYFGARYVGVFEQTGSLRVNDAVAKVASPSATASAP